jgi:hypothetical protein
MVSFDSGTLCGNAFREDPLAASSALAGLIA